MRLLLVFLALFLSISVRVSGQDQNRKLPADLQVNLLFPRANETYAPTQWFPIIFDITNLDAVWPLDVYVDIEIYSMSWRINNTGSSSWQDVAPRINKALLAEAFNSTTPGQQFFHTPLVNMTNGTTDQYAIRWALSLEPRCFHDGSVEEKGWSNRPENGGSRVVMFSSAPGAQVPDIESAVDACPESDQENSVAVRITDVKYPNGLLDEDGQKQTCPVFDTSIEPEQCAYKSLASELATNISTKILEQMGCEEGTWQNITAPCQKKRSAGSPRNPNSGMSWAPLALILVMVKILN
ncbi:LysM domain-containing protein [Colletotrichum higginsianum IMI 349063]|uniref:LysM domain-containing protein n=1 Tax=Colletotrichum higginsianum (strain IMI 349063) TaxID=759273 RepID=A0A1B7XQD0_COLHI|nr:LysM domain-containing protein [Colletotrichum higginsianum IMI 349063]OBR01963.1 LysM domain-containing protein [Colletotrichum higginsianum IMI 349063]